MAQQTRKAKVISTGQEIEVYKLTSGEWCNAKDCTTKYQLHELKFL